MEKKIKEIKLLCKLFMGLSPPMGGLNAVFFQKKPGFPLARPARFEKPRRSDTITTMLKA